MNPIPDQAERIALGKQSGIYLQQAAAGLKLFYNTATSNSKTPESLIQWNLKTRENRKLRNQRGLTKAYMGSMDEGRESDQCIWKLGSITGNEESLKRRRKKSHHFKRSFSLCCFLFLLFLLFRLVLEIGGRRTPEHWVSTWAGAPRFSRVGGVGWVKTGLSRSPSTHFLFGWVLYLLSVVYRQS